MQYSRLAAECPDALRLGGFGFDVFGQTSLEVLRDTMKVIQHSYVKHLDLLPGSVPSDPKKRPLVQIRCFPSNPTTEKQLGAVLLVSLDDEKKLNLTAMAGWCNPGGQYTIMDQPRLWRESIKPEDSEPRPESIATDDSA
jgi:hypothetical protein